MSKQTYIVVAPYIKYPVGKQEVRRDQGARVSDLPAESAAWLLAQGYIAVETAGAGD